MKDVNPSPAAVGGRFDPIVSPTGPLDKRSSAPPASMVQPNGNPINYPTAIPEDTNDPNPKPYPSGKPKPVAPGGVY